MRFSRLFAPAGLLLGLAAAAAESDPALDAVQDIAAAVAQLAGEPLAGPVRAEVTDPDGLVRHLQEKLAQDEELAAALPHTQRMMVLLGMSPPGLDLAEALTTAAAAEVAGFYDPETAALYLVRRPDEAETLSAERLILAHEIAHALDDRRWPLAELQESLNGTTDGDMVAAVLIEGSATVQMLRFAWLEKRAGRLDATGEHFLDHWTDPHTDEYGELPTYFQNRMIGPYILGAGWLAGGVPTGDVMTAEIDPTRERLSAAMEDPPRTTSALLHPERPERDPVEAPLGRLVRKLGWTGLMEDRLGELFTAAVLGRPMPSGKIAFTGDGWTSAAADGWAGDQFLVAARPGGEPADLWLTAWETKEDRDEFAAALAKSRPEVALMPIGDRAALASWGLAEGEPEAIARYLQKTCWKRGNQRWKP